MTLKFVTPGRVPNGATGLSGCLVRSHVETVTNCSSVIAITELKEISAVKEAVLNTAPAEIHSRYAQCGVNGQDGLNVQFHVMVANVFVRGHA